MGGANYTKLGSFINVMDFKTVKDLADYLHYLDKNSTAFNEYFKWRQRYRVADLSFMCSFCKTVTLETRLKPKGYRDLKDFWVTQPFDGFYFDDNYHNSINGILYTGVQKRLLN